MNKSNDSFWDELGLKWCAVDPDIGAITPRLKARLRRQSGWITSGLVCSGLVGAAGVILGVWTIWAGAKSGGWHFVVRGLGISVISALMASAGRLLLSVRYVDHTATFKGMLDLAIQRSIRMVMMTRLGLWACGIAAVAGVIGTIVRSKISAPPQMSPILDLILLGLVAAALHLAGRLGDANRARYTQLQDSLFGDEDRRSP